MITNVNHQQIGNGSWAPASQIPGLSPSAGSVPQEKARGRRVGILETDSDYVKLAKQGGQKGLLWHEDTSMETKTGSQYKAPDWFSADSDSQEECSPGKGTFQPLSAPFGGDNKSAWERDRDGAISGPQNVSGFTYRSSRSNKMRNYQCNIVLVFRARSYEKKAAPVNMSKLLSFGYVEDEKKSPSEDDASSKEAS
uniref:Si:dkey-276j7.1 n=1 Tax=Scleropages formosus TaxID=113540 RepID=A0A8C9TPU5_SCLFO